MQPPNILLISLDTLRADRLGAYGYSRDTSPAIDAFAARSLVFEHAYSHSPVTAPSHMSLMTGVLPPTHGIRNTQQGKARKALSAELPSLAEFLSTNG